MKAATAWKAPPPRRLRTILERLRAEYGRPIARPHRAPIDELVLTVLSQNTNDRNRDVAYERLRDRFDSWDAVRDAPVDEVEEALRPGGISKVKSRRIQAILEAIGDPLDLSHLADLSVEHAQRELCALPGVGRKTANVVLNVALVYGAGLGIAGSALGTVITQWCMAAVLAAVVVRGARRHEASLRPDRRGILAAAHAGIPLVVRTLTLRAALLATTYVATQQGDVSVAAHQVAFTLWTFLAFVLDSIAIAGQAITGRALGASDIDGTRRATRRMITWGLVVGAVAGALLALGRPFLLPLFSSDPAVQAALGDVLLVAALLQPVSGVVFVLDGVLIGAGDQHFLARAMALAALGLAIAIAPVLPLGLGIGWVWAAFGVLMAVRVATLLARFRSDRWLVTGSVA